MANGYPFVDADAHVTETAWGLRVLAAGLPDPEQLPSLLRPPDELPQLFVGSLGIAGRVVSHGSFLAVTRRA